MNSNTLKIIFINILLGTFTNRFLSFRFIKLEFMFGFLRIGISTPVKFIVPMTEDRHTEDPYRPNQINRRPLMKNENGIVLCYSGKHC